MTKKSTLSVFLAGLLVFLSVLPGCLSRSYVEKHTYMLDVSRDGEVAPPENGIVLRVRKLRISPQYEGTGFVYRTGDLSYQSDFYNEFFTSPDSMITEEVLAWLAKSGLFQHVVDYTDQMESTYVVEGTITDLYGDYSRGTQAKGVMAVELFFIEDVAGRSRILLQKRYRREIPLKGDSPEALVEGWNKALQHILRQFESDLRETLSHKS
ncbi:MAG: membrane integrity-associated transporter subunit PqiC [Deltaproteobacteria bacterium]|nr:membrane integrity-associated transporter subunit PqiC [Deltaproteobacteria bacterium]MBW2122084.1 membrane integrity-associated transporter subunit PqiC [Deltaproteobacteria bacterium]